MDSSTLLLRFRSQFGGGGRRTGRSADEDEEETSVEKTEIVLGEIPSCSELSEQGKQCEEHASVKCNVCGYLCATHDTAYHMLRLCKDHDRMMLDVQGDGFEAEQVVQNGQRDDGEWIPPWQRPDNPSPDKPNPSPAAKTVSHRAEEEEEDGGDAAPLLPDERRTPLQPPSAGAPGAALTPAERAMLRAMGTIQPAAIPIRPAPPAMPSQRSRARRPSARSLVDQSSPSLPEASMFTLGSFDPEDSWHTPRHKRVEAPATAHAQPGHAFGAPANRDSGVQRVLTDPSAGVFRRPASNAFMAGSRVR
eukprot:TRINITY_DN12555_c0_g1_i2.p2 TRINITY_DN12555_c0_g1~~TRINITY_DN12555_c0_g1_i2.p2  ORF type:complete len:306 (+),score=66.77 TRINITY_DN12555_c0_g1_i2:1298-2215(+)